MTGCISRPPGEWAAKGTGLHTLTWKVRAARVCYCLPCVRRACAVRAPCVCAMRVPFMRRACAVHVPCSPLQVPLLLPGTPSYFVAEFATPPGMDKEGRIAQPVQAACQIPTTANSWPQPPPPSLALA